MYNEIFNNTGKVQISRKKNKFKSEIKWSAKKQKNTDMDMKKKNKSKGKNIWSA